ncbi:MAG: PPC domain-containing DNA-binding protein [Dehalococcoidia bacterium]
MKTKLLQPGPAKIWAVVFDADEEAVSGLTRAAKQEGMNGSTFTAIGALKEATVGYFERDKRDYLQIPVNEQVEVLSLVGNIAIHDGEPKLHAHVVLGKRDGSTVGGHLLKAHVWPTLEVMVTESPGELRRTFDEESQLPLINLDAG